MNIFQKLQKIGQRSKKPDYVNAKIRLSNLIAFFNILLVALPFVFIAYIYVPQLTIIPVLGIVFMATVWLFNRIGQIYLARVISAILPLLLTVLFTSNLIADHQELPTVMFMIMLGFSIIPFLVFDIREKQYLIFSIVVNFLFFVGTLYFPIKWIGSIDTSFITEGVLFDINYIVSILLTYAIVFMLAFINYKSELKSQDLIRQNKLQNEELHNSEKELQDKLAEVQQAQEEEKNRAWITEGITNINTITRQYDDPDELSKEVIKEIVKYLNANQGAIYLVEEDEENDSKVLEMKAAYAFGRRKQIKSRVLPGEGLVGQSYLEKDKIYLTDVPDSYVRIRSGLGDAPPKNIVIMPLITNEKVEGILEIASFEILEDFKVQYLEQLGESLATSFNLNRINANTKRLLELSQEQEEQMRSQAEELHQNMEELEATQEEMERKNRDTEEKNQELQQQKEELRQNTEELDAQAGQMKLQMDEMERMQSEMQAREDILNQSTIVSEADLYGNITYVNEKLIEVAKYTKEEMIGKPHNLFRHPDMPAELFKLLWDTIKSGNVFRGIIKNKAKDGSVYWVDATISPVFDADNNPVKYIGVRYVIEQEEIALQLFNQQLERLNLG